MTKPIRRRIVVDGVERILPEPTPKLRGKGKPITPTITEPARATLDQLRDAFTEDLQKVYIERDGQFLEIGVLAELNVSFDRIDVTSFSDPSPRYMRGFANVEMTVRGTIA